MLIYQEFLAVNEEMAAYDPNERLRYCVHEILLPMKADETITFTNLSKRLKEEWKIDISPDLLKAIFEAWDKYQNPDYTVFKKEDKNWMDVWTINNYVKKKARDKQNFGKHRKKETGFSKGYWKGHKWIAGDDEKRSTYYDSRYYNEYGWD